MQPSSNSSSLVVKWELTLEGFLLVGIRFAAVARFAATSKTYLQVTYMFFILQLLYTKVIPFD
jgi:hypothetical protein